MATTTAPRKGPGSASAAVPPCSFSNRQRKLGPAPFASMESFESDLEELSPPDPDIHKLQPMPQIKEDSIRSPDEEPGGGGGGGGITQFGGVTVIPSGAATMTNTMTSSSAPTSGPTSGLQTPSTPRIDISCASSSTPPSEESNSERELFSGGLGLAFQEEMADDLRSSTEELEFGDENIHDERRRKEPEDPLRRASQPALPRKASMTPTDEDFLHRKPSAHSLFLEGLLQRPCRHSSFGAADRIRPGAISSLSAGADGRRSASPHKMLLETSFCGNKPIPTPSIDLDSPPKPPSHEPRLQPMENSGMISSDSSFESHKPITLTTVQVHHHHHHHQQQHPSTSNNSGGRSMTMTNSSSTGSTGADSRKNLQKVETPDSPKSSDHWKPISPKPQNSSSSYTSPDNQNKFFNADFNTSSFSSPLPTRKNSNNTNSPITLTMSRKNSNANANGSGNKLITESPTISHAPMTPGMTRKNIPPATPQRDKSRVSNDSISIQKTKTSGSSSTTTANTCGFDNNFSNNNTSSNQISSTSKVKKSAETTTNTTTSSSHVSKTTATSTSSASKSSSAGKKEKSSSHNNSSSTSSNISNSKQKEITKDVKAVAQKTDPREMQVQMDAGGKNSGKSKDKKGKSSSSSKHTESSSSRQKPSSSSSSKPLENDEITTEMKITEDAMLPLQDSVPMETETKGFFLDSLDDEEDLPYVPTTLPLEKSVAIPIIPIKERRKFFVTTTPIQRPRARPPNPTTLSDFISSTTTSQTSNCNSSTKSDTTTTQKMKINLPRDDSLPETSSKEVRPKSPKKKLSTTWTDFAEMGLRSPREIRRRMREENGDTDVTYHSDSSQDTGPVVNETGGSDDETESLLKLPKIPFAMDLDVKSNRSSVVSQEEAPPSPSNLSAQLDQEDDDQ